MGRVEGAGVLIKAFTLSRHQACRKCEKLSELYLKDSYEHMSTWSLSDCRLYNVSEY